MPGGPSQAVPGSIPTGSISKLKSQLRQTRRLLAKEDLTPDVRTTSERRLQTLESELAKAERGELEKKMVTKYRGVRFFERQKLLRKIKQAKKALEQDGETPNAEHQRALLEARIDLAYVLRYPKTQKYVALFPEGSYQPHATSPPSSSAPDSEVKRHELRQKMLNAMSDWVVGDSVEDGHLGIEGEEDVSGEADGIPKVGGKRARSDATVVPQAHSKRSRVEPTGPPTIASTSKPELAANPTEAPAPVAPASSGAIAATDTTETVKSNKKIKKDAKDAKRRAKKLAAAAAGDGDTATKPTIEAAEAAPKKRRLAEEDDFFA